MKLEAKQAEYYRSDLFSNNYDKIQIITIEALLNHEVVKLPMSNVQTFKKADKLILPDGDQTKLF